MDRESRLLLLEARRAQATKAAELIEALPSARRLFIRFRRFKSGAMTGGQMADELDMHHSSLSKRTVRTREQGIIDQPLKGRRVIFRSNDATFARIPSLLHTICASPRVEPARPGGGTMKLMSTAAIVLGLSLTSIGAICADTGWVTPTVIGAGRIHPVPHASYQPDTKASYKVVFNLTGGSDKPDKPNFGIEGVARTVNLYVNAGVPLTHLHFVAVASAKATAIALDDEQYKKQFGVANPNLPIIRQLRKAGVDVAVCGQAVAEHHYDYAWVDSHVTLALSALTTVTELQQKGYALISF